MHSGGKQIVLINEYDGPNKFYRNWGVEADIRDIAARYPNSYSMAFFACCRELYAPETIHKDGIKAPEKPKQILEPEPTAEEIKAEESEERKKKERA